MSIVVDACGLSCPEPVLKLKQTLDTSPNLTEISLLVDSQVCVENCSRFAESSGFAVKVEEKDGLYTMSLKKGK